VGGMPSATNIKNTVVDRSEVIPENLCVTHVRFAANR
jgi:hypothetical protein